MLGTTTYQLDVDNDAATIVIAGTLSPADISALIGRCRELAAHVVTLRIDARSLGAMSAGDVEVVRAVLLAWRQTRGGSFQLTSSHLMATCRQVAAPPAPVWSSTISRVRTGRPVRHASLPLAASY